MVTREPESYNTVSVMFATYDIQGVIKIPTSRSKFGGHIGCHGNGTNFSCILGDFCNLPFLHNFSHFEFQQPLA